MNFDILQLKFLPFSSYICIFGEYSKCKHHIKPTNYLLISSYFGTVGEYGKCEHHVIHTDYNELRGHETY